MNEFVFTVVISVYVQMDFVFVVMGDLVIANSGVWKRGKQTFLTMGILWLKAGVCCNSLT
jgi:hypothetical protein